MPYVEFHRWILAAVLAMARIGGAFAVCPALTDSMIPGVARRAAVLGFSCLAIPYLHAEMPPGEPNVWMFAVLAFREALIGFLIGFFAAIPFWVAENVGNFIDNQRGATMGEVYSPLSGAQVSTTGIFFTQVVSTIFFTSGAPAIIVMFLATIGLGLVNRTAPQLNVFFLSMPVKSALGIAMLVVYLPFIMDMLMYTKEGAILGPVRRLIGG